MSLGGSKTTQNSIDPALRDAALQNLAMARQVGQLGFVPYTEATVAGMSPAQIAAIQNTNAGAAAFGLTPSAVPTGADLSPYSIYQTALQNMAPGQRAFIEGMFINPMTGAAPTAPMSAAGATAPATKYERVVSGGDGGSSGRSSPTKSNRSGRSTTSMNTPMSYAPGGVNTRNPASLTNRLAAALSSGARSAPTAADRPMPRPTTGTTRTVSSTNVKPAAKPSSAKPSASSKSSSSTRGGNAGRR